MADTGGAACTTPVKVANLPAFPGADGAAARIKDGRGGTVYHVTKLDTDFSNSAPGTLRYGLSLTGPRTIVFDISGVFSLGRAAVSGWNANGNGWDTASRLTIPADVTLAGQTAPAPVILMGGVIKPGGTNIILRNVMYVYDAIDISGQNVMIDHVTAIYATDETMSMNEMANKVTIQHCILALGQNYLQADAEASGTKYTGHALGSLFQAGSNANVSVLHNLYAHLKGRLPRVGTEAAALTAAGIGAYNDFRNNVFYNWLGTAGMGSSGQASQNNFVGNFYLAGTRKIVAWADEPFNTSATEGTEWRALVATPAVSRPVGFDADGDGMRDSWESAHGLDPKVADNNGDFDFDCDGSTHLEEYLNQIAA